MVYCPDHRVHGTVSGVGSVLGMMPNYEALNPDLRL